MLDRKIINKIVRAIGIKEGEVVLLHFWGEDSERELLHNFRSEVVSLGGTPIEMQQSRSVNAKIFRNAKESCFGEKYFKLFDCVDIVIDLCMYQPVILGISLEEDQMNRYRKYMSSLFKKLTSCNKFVQLRIPTDQYALEEGFDAKDFINKMTKAYDIDYDLLKKTCEEKKLELKDKKNIVIHTKGDCSLQLCIEGREWNLDAGEGDLPCGEIYIAPIEEKTNGTIYFEKLWLDVDCIVSDVVLTIEDGKIIGSNSEVFDNFITELPPNGNTICEFGIGMNRNVEELTGYAALDEKKAGTFHIAIGMNTLFGGKNDCMMHMDFVGVGEVEIIS